MAPRGRTPTVEDDFYRSGDSSPDPLALSLNENTVQSARKTSPRKPLRTTSPSKQNRRLSVSEMDLSSPSKSMIVSTPRMGSASPWRIKVTVQAEPGSENENADSPSIKRVTRTQTTTVPLKDPDAPSPVKRGRGRPRKSDIGVAAKPKRNGTPAKRTARSKSRDASVRPLDLSAAEVDVDAPPKRKRGRPRKSTQPVTLDADAMPWEEQQVLDGPAEETVRPTPVTHVEIADQPTSASRITSQESTAGPSRKQAQTRSQPEHDIRDENATPRPGLSKQVRNRKGTPHAKKNSTAVLSGESDEDAVLTPTSEAEDDGMPLDTQSAHIVEDFEDIAEPKEPSQLLHTGNDGSQIADNFVEVHSIDSASESDDDDGQERTSYAFDEGTTRMPDDTTVLDSENFSMISVDSLPSSGGFTSPAVPEQRSGTAPRLGPILEIGSASQGLPVASPSLSQVAPQSSPALSRDFGSLKPQQGSVRPSIRRYKTPVVDTVEPAGPPAIEPPQPSQAKTESPRIGRVVTAGVALQGVLDPTRLTPGPTQRLVSEERDRLDDLFRGFSEGTRKELQAGLRLGEQLAQDEGKSERSSSTSSPSAGPSSKPRGKGVFKTERKTRQPRLLTPEDHDDDVSMPADKAELGNVQYPELQIDENASQLLSPARSVDEMSWRVDTPPVTTGNSERMRNLSVQVDKAIEDEAANQFAANPKSTQAPQEDYTDIWQEEASRSSNSLEDDNIPQILEPSMVVPARGKLPRTWRRKSGNHFQYSDEAESPQQPAAEFTEAAAQEPLETTEIAEDNVTPDEDVGSEASDDTGIFFQSNLPTLFSKRHSRELKQKKADKLDLSLLMKEGESLVPDSSPMLQTKTSSTTATKNNPFLDTPPRFTGYLSSPQKSSPLRQELRGSDISSQSPSHFQEESSLPLPQSSPFHTYVEGQSMQSVASDQRQLYMEMEGVTDSSIRRVRNEADEYLDAYEPQERSLHEIEEVTEHSRTWHQNRSAIASSPPQLRMLSPVRKRKPLFGTPDKPEPGSHQELLREEGDHVDDQAQVIPAPASEQEHAADSAPQRPSGLLTRMTSTLWSAVTNSSPAEPVAESLPPHPILSKLTPLPKVEPWTKTHYKTLDKLYSLQYKRPELFSPTASPPTALSQTNTDLLNSFLDATKKPYLGAIFSAWGYEMEMTEELVVLCAIFVELLTLDSIEEYEALKGREIELGDCLPRKTGDVIEAEEVVRRLATVVLGEEVRNDEKKGVKIDRRKGLEVVWPQ